MGTGHKGMDTMRRLVRYRLLTALLLVVASLLLLRGKGGAEGLPEKGHYIRNLTMVSKFLPADFSPDGNLSKQVWKDASRVKFDLDRLGGRHYPDNETQVASLWTPGYVYFAYWCRYRTLTVFTGEDSAKEKPNLYARDVVEIFINPHPERFTHYYEFEFSPNDLFWDIEVNLVKGGNLEWNSNLDHAAKIDPMHKTFVLEMRIPVKPMEVNAIHQGDIWRLNNYRVEGPTEPQKRYMAWSQLPDGSSGSFHQPSCFGIIKFVK
jgi:hypothetical protein